MARTMLTARTIEVLKPGTDRREIADRHMPGLYLILQPSGAKSWAVRYRHHGVTRKHTLGPYPVIDLKAARDLAGRALRAVAEGRDPGHEKRVQNLDTVEAVAQRFIELHCRRAGRPDAARATQRLLELYALPRWRGRMARDITRRDVLDVLDRVVASNKPIAANRTLAAVRRMFNWAVSRDILATSPCVGVKRPSAEQSRERTLNDIELRDVWLGADAVGGPFGALVKLLILSGQRRNEVARIRWSEIDLTGRLWALPAARTKNNRAHEIPLSGPVVTILMELPRLGEFALTMSGKTAATGYSVNKRKLDTLLPPDMPAWRLHDLRRTTASGMARLGISLPVIEKVLNHAGGSFAGIVGVYQRHSFAEEKRRALEAWAAFVVDLVSDNPRQNVVDLAKARA
jgi:integrase